MPIQGFEKYTQQITSEEFSQIARLKLFLSIATKERPISAKELVSMFDDAGYQTSGPRIRKMVNVLRTTEYHDDRILAANNKGYYWTKNFAEMLEYTHSLRNRMNEIRRVLYHCMRPLTNYIKSNPDEAQKAIDEKNAIEKVVQPHLPFDFTEEKHEETETDI